jgi:aldose 1-epimerase
MKEQRKRSCTKSGFGTMPDGRSVELYTLTNSNGVIVTITTYGATVVSIIVPDRNGVFGDISLGFDSVAGYLQPGNPYFGSTIGRYGNRLGKGRFTLNGKTYQLATNNGVNHLHGGPKGFDKVLWTAAPVVADVPKVVMSYESPDGEEGYPGTLIVSVAFSLNDANELEFVYTATADRDTIFNPTNHAYFNLNCKGDILGHVLQIHAQSFTPVDDTLIPTGEIRNVAGTPFDFTCPEKIGARINRTDDQQIANGGGYDHNFVCNGGGALTKIATAFSPESGRMLEVLTTEPGVQLYSGNFLDGSLTGKNGIVYNKRNGFCLETQHFPDSPNKPSFPTTVLKAGQKFSSTTINRFSVAEQLK